MNILSINSYSSNLQSNVNFKGTLHRSVTTTLQKMEKEAIDSLIRSSSYNGEKITQVALDAIKSRFSAIKEKLMMLAQKLSDNTMIKVKSNSSHSWLLASAKINGEEALAELFGNHSIIGESSKFITLDELEKRIGNLYSEKQVKGSLLHKAHENLSSKIGKGKVSSPKKFSKLLDEWDVVNGSPVSRDCITRVFDRQQARMTAEKESLKMLSLGDRIRYSLAKFFE